MFYHFPGILKIPSSRVYNDCSAAVVACIFIQQSGNSCQSVSFSIISNMNLTPNDGKNRNTLKFFCLIIIDDLIHLGIPTYRLKMNSKHRSAP